MMNPEFEQLAEDFSKRAEKIGLYSKDCVIVGSKGDEEERDQVESKDIKELLASGEIKLAMIVTFTVGDLAFSERIQNPDKFDTDLQFQQMMPTAEEMTVDTLRDRFDSLDENSSIDDILAMFDDIEDAE
jgi:hypothetical protein